MPEYIELNEGHFTEALERMYLLDQITQMMKEHSVFQKYCDLEARLTELQYQMLGIYQAVGKKEDEWKEANQYSERDE